MITVKKYYVCPKCCVIFERNDDLFEKRAEIDKKMMVVKLESSICTECNKLNRYELKISRELWLEFFKKLDLDEPDEDSDEEGYDDIITEDYWDE
jgi:hypothetical protein